MLNQYLDLKPSCSLLQLLNKRQLQLCSYLQEAGCLRCIQQAVGRQVGVAFQLLPDPLPSLSGGSSDVSGHLKLYAKAERLIARR
jgi:hypothetical protein